MTCQHLWKNGELNLNLLSPSPVLTSQDCPSPFSSELLLLSAQCFPYPFPSNPLSISCKKDWCFCGSGLWPCQRGANVLVFLWAEMELLVDFLGLLRVPVRGPRSSRDFQSHLYSHTSRLFIDCLSDKESGGSSQQQTCFCQPRSTKAKGSDILARLQGTIISCYLHCTWRPNQGPAVLGTVYTYTDKMIPIIKIGQSKGQISSPLKSTDVFPLASKGLDDAVSIWQAWRVQEV